MKTKSSIIRKLSGLLLSFFCIINAPAQCPRVLSIFVQACATPEGLNEFFVFNNGVNAINTNNIDIVWATTTINFSAFIQNAATATKVSTFNNAIIAAGGCGRLIEPVANIIPANAKVIVFTSQNVDVTSVSFGVLGEDIYVLFNNNASNGTGHFANSGTGTRSLTLSVSAPVNCSQTVTYDRSQLASVPGASVNFSATGVASYFSNGCVVPSNNAAAATITLTSASANISTCTERAMAAPITFLVSNATGVLTTGLPAGVSGVYNTTSKIFTISGTPTTVGSYLYKVKTIGGCGVDSLQGTITVSPYLTATRNARICPGQGYTFKGITYTTAVSGIRDTFSNVGSCDSIVTLNLILDPYAAGTRNVHICQGKSYTFNGITYTSGVTGVTDTFPNPVGCDSIVTLNLIVDPYPTAIKDITMCQGQVFDFNGTHYTSSIYGVTDTIINPGGCDSIITLNLTVIATAQQIVAMDSIIACQYDTVRLETMALPLNNNYTYQWSPATGLDNSQHPNVWLRATTTRDYTLRVTRTENNLPCSIDHTIHVIVNPGDFLKVNLTDTGICPGNKVSLLATGAQSYAWSPALYLDTVTSSNPVSSAETSMNYTVIGTNNKGCRDTQQVQITVHPAAVLNIPRSINIYGGETYQMEPLTNAVHFSWFPNSGLNSTGISNPLMSPEVNTRYFVRATTENGCSIFDSTDVYVKGTVIDMPNAFTPNNSSFKASKRGIATLHSFKIFNRWGEEVFSTTNIEQGWDGNFKGAAQATGVYIYMIDAITQEGKVFKKQGTVTLVR
ncbi:hypothetical protein DBR32_13670 [Taibaiella sp. KBW10]|uniref:T9SS type B sorting domain-containing protein n=1 Tax=Taibaiella sp. KBW10 TaxID=2153357 RepID=UPI000F59A005|nr:gliding motility-associated C-terminal domain-containing protein [Taibaiella sp. KBW10]RQO29958.1 hypothetical protein DBR32_13670 [Taibaiella sp. KBW10]